MANTRISELVWTDELIRTFWDGFSHTHLENLSFGRLAGPQFLEFVREYLPAGAQICDYGAGSGHLAELLIKAGFATAIYEPSPGRAETLRRRLSLYDRFLGVVGSKDGGQFDLVIMAEVIEHLPGHALDETLMRIRGLLRDNGTLILTTPNDENLGEAQVFCPVCQQTYHPWQHVRSFTHHSLEKQLNEYGFAGRFVGLVDFSNYAPAIERSRLFPAVCDFMMLLGNELAELVQRLPLDAGQKTQVGRAGGSSYTTEDPRFDHDLILGEIAKLREHTTAQIGRISWPQVEEALPAALFQLCDEFYSRLHLLIDAQQKRVQFRKLQAQSQTDIQHLKNIVSNIICRFRSVDRAVSGMGITARFNQQGLDFLRSPRSRFYWAARFFWEFLRDPELLADVMTMPRALADHAHDLAEVGRVTEPNVTATGPSLPDASEVFGTTEGVRLHLSSIGVRIANALDSFDESRAKRRAELGYDMLIGRGSTILYIGEKV